MDPGSITHMFLDSLYLLDKIFLYISCKNDPFNAISINFTWIGVDESVLRQFLEMANFGALASLKRSTESSENWINGDFIREENHQDFWETDEADGVQIEWVGQSPLLPQGFGNSPLQVVKNRFNSVGWRTVGED